MHISQFIDCMSTHQELLQPEYAINLYFLKNNFETNLWFLPGPEFYSYLMIFLIINQMNVFISLDNIINNYGFDT